MKLWKVALAQIRFSGVNVRLEHAGICEGNTVGPFWYACALVTADSNSATIKNYAIQVYQASESVLVLVDALQ